MKNIALNQSPEQNGTEAVEKETKLTGENLITHAIKGAFSSAADEGMELSEVYNCVSFGSKKFASEIWKHKKEYQGFFWRSMAQSLIFFTRIVSNCTSWKKFNSFWDKLVSKHEPINISPTGIVPMTRRRLKGLKLSTCSRTVVKRNCFENSLRKVCNWLQGFKLIPEKIPKT